MNYLDWFFNVKFQRVLDDRSDRTSLVDPSLLLTGFNRIGLDSNNLLHFRICNSRVSDSADSVDQAQLECGFLADQLDLQFWEPVKTGFDLVFLHLDRNLCGPQTGLKTDQVVAIGFVIALKVWHEAISYVIKALIF